MLIIENFTLRIINYVVNSRFILAYIVVSSLLAHIYQPPFLLRLLALLAYFYAAYRLKDIEFELSPQDLFRLPFVLFEQLVLSLDQFSLKLDIVFDIFANLLRSFLRITSPFYFEARSPRIVLGQRDRIILMHVLSSDCSPIHDLWLE